MKRTETLKACQQQDLGVLKKLFREQLMLNLSWLAGKKITLHEMKVLVQALADPDCQIQHIDLSHNNLKTSIIIPFSNIFKHQHNHLMVAILINNSLGISAISHLSSSLMHPNNQLVCLDLDGNRLGPKGFMYLLKALTNANNKLLFLYLADNAFGEDSIENFSEALKNIHCKLKVLSWRRGEALNEPHMLSLSGALTHSNCRLIHLDLSNNITVAKGIEQLTQALINANCQLKFLLLRHCVLKSTALCYISIALQHKNCKLISLDLSYNYIDDAGIVSLSQALQHSNCKLKALNLSSNTIGATGLLSLAETLIHPDCQLTILNLMGSIPDATSTIKLAEALNHPNCKIFSIRAVWNKPYSVQQTVLEIMQANKKLIDANFHTTTFVGAFNVLLSNHICDVCTCVDYLAGKNFFEAFRLFREGLSLPAVLLKAIERGALLAVQWILHQGDFIFELMNWSWDTPLSIAAENGQLEIAQLLCQQGASPVCINQGGVSPYTLAVNNGHIELARFLAAAMHCDVIMQHYQANEEKAEKPVWECVRNNLPTFFITNAKNRPNHSWNSLYDDLIREYIRLGEEHPISIFYLEPAVLYQCTIDLFPPALNRDLLNLIFEYGRPEPPSPKELMQFCQLKCYSH